MRLKDEWSKRQKLAPRLAPAEPPPLPSSTAAPEGGAPTPVSAVAPAPASAPVSAPVGFATPVFNAAELAQGQGAAAEAGLISPGGVPKYPNVAELHPGFHVEEMD